MHTEAPITCVLCDRDVTPNSGDLAARITVAGQQPAAAGQRGPGICPPCLLVLMGARER
jgi:hypothetical protein